MPTILGDTYPISYPNVPAGMSSQDNLIWARFRPTVQTRFEVFYANVRVGSGQPALPGTDPASAALLQTLTQHRIDIILAGPGLLWLMEVRNNAGSGALGTILTNSSLYEQDPLLGRDYTRVILTNDVDPDSRRAIELAGVQLIVV